MALEVGQEALRSLSRVLLCDDSCEVLQLLLLCLASFNVDSPTLLIVGDEMTDSLGPIFLMEYCYVRRVMMGENHAGSYLPNRSDLVVWFSSDWYTSDCVSYRSEHHATATLVDHCDMDHTFLCGFRLFPFCFFLPSLCKSHLQFNGQI